MTQSKLVRGSAARTLRPRNRIRHRILTKFGVLMGIMVPHHLPNFFQNWPTDGREAGHFRGAEGGLGTDAVHGHAEAAIQIHECFIIK